MKDLESKIDTVVIAYDKAQRLRREAEELTEMVYQSLGIHKNQRTTEPGDAMYYITQCRDILKGIYRGSLS